MTLKAKKYSFIIILDHVDFPNATIKNTTNTIKNNKIILLKSFLLYFSEKIKKKNAKITIIKINDCKSFVIELNVPVKL